MILLKEEDFFNLMNDFYTIFCPHKLSGLQSMCDKYKDTAASQLSAIKTAYLIHFKPNSYVSNILPEVATEKNILQLMESYSMGNRIISEEKLQEIQKNKEQEKQILEQKTKDIESKQLDFLRDQIQKQENNEVKALKQEIDKLNTTINSLNKKSDKKYEKKYIISTFKQVESIDSSGKQTLSDYDYTHLTFPDTEFFFNLSIGQKIIMLDENGGIIGIEVLSMYDDICSEENTIIRFIDLKKI